MLGGGISIAIVRTLYYNLGKGETSMNKPYHERPDWILKSIVYFCDNYTIDGKDLREFKRGAIATYRGGVGGSIDDSLAWEYTPEYREEGLPRFWVCLWFLQTGERRIGADVDNTKCAPWTDYEKRKIAKMPRVK
jgi:hypothetical protein